MGPRRAGLGYVRRPIVLLLTRVLALALLGLAATASAAAGHSDARLANGCFALRSAASGELVRAEADGYRADDQPGDAAARFHLKPSTLGAYLPHDQDSRLLAARADGSVGRDRGAGPATEWRPVASERPWFHFRSTSTGQWLGVSPAGSLVQAPRSDPSTRFALPRRAGCTPFPEAEPGAAGDPFAGTNPDGTVAGFADIHLHITADLRAGGEVIYGEAFNRFGIAEALGHDADVHGPEGVLDVTGNLLRTGLPVGTHDTDGWPSFSGWPVHDTNTHQQIYYAWLQRAWMAGERLVVAQTVEDEPLCEIEPIRSHSCDEFESIELQVRRLRGLQDYVDAQAGGRGRGWFRLVYRPRQARRAIEAGKLAVVIGVESSTPFGCSELLDRPQCNRDDIDRGIARFRDLGIRSIFPIHWVDNALGGAAIEGGDKGTFINAMNAYQTGHFFRTGPCPEPGQGEELAPLSLIELGQLSLLFPALRALAGLGVPLYPPEPQCNKKGLTALGEYAIRRLMEEEMLIEADHMSEWARARVLEIAEQERYPLVSSHTDTGGHWTPSQLTRLYELGGFATARPDIAPALAARILELRQHRSEHHYFGVALGSDTGGFSSLPPPRPDAADDPLAYPFTSFDGAVEFEHQRSGERVYDLNRDGIAHYGLFADLLADVHEQHGDAALRPLFSSAEAYLRMWERAVDGT